MYFLGKMRRPLPMYFLGLHRTVACLLCIVHLNQRVSLRTIGYFVIVIYLRPILGCGRFM